MSVSASPSLRFAPTAPAGKQAWSAFCSHCGAAPPAANPAASRVCAGCGMGLVLSAPPDVAPGRGEAFLVVTASLLVGAVSEAAEHFLDVTEGEAVNRPVTELLTSAEAEPGAVDLVTTITRAAAGEADRRRAVVRPAATFGVRCRARIGPCGPPSAAVLVLDG
jgi:hypothetical protein